VTRQIAALYVDPSGIYSRMPGVDCWGIERDARSYAGPHPVVAHPPCQRWGPLAKFVQARYAQYRVGDDGGTFAAALAAVRRWGGVLEHPAKSLAWRAHGLLEPSCKLRGGWSVADDVGGWTCQIEQIHYGHRARKATWLYACHVDLPSLLWGAGPKGVRVAGDGYHSAEERARKTRPVHVVPAEEEAKRRRGERVEGGIKRMGKKEREATPQAFADLLVEMARTSRVTS
jgi:hypothetical protein